MKPTVGRIVHFYTEELQMPRPAIITHVDPVFGGCDLFVMTTNSSYHVWGIHERSDAGKGWWSWPPQEYVSPGSPK